MPDETTLQELLVNQAPDAIVFADRAGLIQTWNTAAEALFGHSAAEAIGQNLDLIIPESFREAHWTGYERALNDGETKYRGQSMPTKSVHRDGSTIYVELSFAIVHDRAGAVIGALAHARNITERWAQERTQRRRLRELEEQVASAAEPTTA